MAERELMERIATCDPTLLLMHIEEDTAYDAAILGKVFELAKEQARAALASSDAQADGGKSEAVAEVIKWRTLTGHTAWDFKVFDKTLEHGTKLYRAPQAECAPRDAWQPIETAPKDGSMFLGWVDAVRYGESDEGEQFEQDVSGIDFCRWQMAETGGYFENLTGPIADAEHITHWMPIPAAPVRAALSKEPQ